MPVSTERIRFGANPWGRPLPVVELGVLADTVGFDSVWIGDHLADVPMPKPVVTDPWILLAAIGGRTKRVMLSQSTTDCIRIHPAKIAHMVAALDELTSGRASLGIGSGEAMNTIPYGMPFGSVKERVQRLKETVKIIRLLWSSSVDTPVSFKGQFYSLDRARLDQPTVQKPHPPIYMGALGSEASLTAAGELGDGWIPWVMSQELYAKSVQILKSAAEKAHRRFDTIDRAAIIQVAFTEDSRVLQQVRDDVKAGLVWLRTDLRMHGINVSLPIDYSYQRLWATKKEAQAIVEASKQIPDEFIEGKFVATGSVDTAIEFIEGFIKAGATHIVVRDAVGKLESGIKTFKTVGEKIIPYLKGL